MLTAGVFLAGCAQGTKEIVTGAGENLATGKLDISKWTIATYASSDSRPGVNQGVYVRENVDFSPGGARIVVNQRRLNEHEVQSLGGAIVSKERFGFGTYTFVLRMSSTAS